MKQGITRHSTECKPAVTIRAASILLLSIGLPHVIIFQGLHRLISRYALRKTSMKILLVITAFLSLAIFPTFIMADNYSLEDKKFKTINIDKLKPYGPGFNEEQRPIWQQMIKIAVKYEDYEILENMFLIHDEVDGVMSTQYSLDLFEIYKQKPLFFVNSVDQFYRGDFNKFLPIWINETFDIQIKDLTKYAIGITENKVMKIFLITAEELNNQIE
jgi:hypothetical protein